MPETQEYGGSARPSRGVLIFFLVFISLAGTLMCATFLQRVRRSRSTRTLVAALTNRLRFSSSRSAAPHHPEAKPSKYMKRFAGVDVVDGNAVIDKVQYERLREFPHALVEVSEAGTNVESADFSQTEVATTAGSLYSRSGSHFHASRTFSPRPREGSVSTTPSQLGEAGNSFYNDSSSLQVDAEEGVDNGERRRFVNVHSVPPTAHVCESAQHGYTSSPVSRQPMAATATTMTAAVAQDSDSPFGANGAHELLGRRVITNISVEDLAAHCAALEENDEDNDGGEESDVCSSEDKDGEGGSRGAAEREGSKVDGDQPSTDHTAHHHHHHHHHHHRERQSTPLTPYTFIMRQKEKRARTAHSVVVVDAKPTGDTSLEEEGEERGTGEDVGVPAHSPAREMLREGSGAAAYENTKRDGDQHEEEEEEEVVVVPVSRRPRPRRTVHREHHIHHVDKGGFIVCQDFVPDLASRRARRRQANAPKQRYVFQLKDEDALYGRSEYLPPQTHRGDDVDDEDTDG